MNIEKIVDFRMNEVKVIDSYIDNSLQKELDYLKSFDADRLVAGFLEVNDMRPKKDKYNGWEVILQYKGFLI